MNKCICQSDNCKGEIKRYSVHSPKDNTIYPNRFWGVIDYCEHHAKDEVDNNGFTLNNVSMDTHLATL